MTLELPRKLKNDSIVEALFEIRFDAQVLDEITIGKLCDNPAWNTYSQSRTGISDIPTHIRQADPSLKYQPLVELNSPEKNFKIRISGNVLSIHRYSPYIGWDSFEEYLNSAIDYLFTHCKISSVVRLGLRYINLLQSSEHNVNSLHDLHMSLHIAEQVIEDDINLAFTKCIDDSTQILTRIATPAFISNNSAPQDTICIIDVDVNLTECEKYSSSDAKSWLTNAHNEEKSMFFSFFPKDWLTDMAE